MDSVTIGVDIGASAIRAAEVHVSKDGRRHLRRYAQVGIPAGYVVDGEINNTLGVTEALKRLWAEGGFSSNDVVMGISGPRVFVRQADVPALPAEDLRSSLKFDAQELVPIAMEDACFDFSILGPNPPGDGGSTASTQRILLVAAHRDVLRNYVTTARSAGLNPTVLDAAPLALMRAVPPGPSGGGVEVIVSIGAELTTVAVREAGVPRFIRSLTLGGSKLTAAIADKMHVEVGVAERLKRAAMEAGTPQLGSARRAMGTEVRDLAEEVRATVDFFLSQADSAQVERLLVTGGAAQMEGLAHAIGGNLPAPVLAVDPLATLDLSALPYGPEYRSRLTATSATAVGLALWPTEAPLIRLSVLPEEILAARKARRLMTMAGAGVAGLVGVLAFVSAGQVLAVRHEHQKVDAALAQQAALTSTVTKLTAESAVHAEVQQRAALVSAALHGDIDWARVLGQLASSMPADVHLISFSGGRTPVATSASASASSHGTSSDGTVTFQVKGTGGLPAVSAWLQGLEADGDLSQVWVSGVTVKTNGGDVVYSSTANLTAQSQSNRDKEVQP